MARSVTIADFETTTLADDCRVWAWGLAYIDTPDDVEIDDTLDNFIYRVSMENLVCYFHNLRFDGTFIIDWLLKHGYSHTGERFCRHKKSFKTLISELGQFYSIVVKWSNGFATEFRDSYKKLPFTVDKIAKAFNLPEAKGELDYTLPRPLGWVATTNERDYIRRDVSIVARALKTLFDQGARKLTIGADALAEYKSLTPEFESLFPVVSDAMDDEIRRAYRGGFTYASERFRGKRQGAGVTLDVNSLYPYVMRTMPMPYGFPDYHPGYVEPGEGKLNIFSVTFTAKLKKNHIPCIQVKGNVRFRASEYVKEILEPLELCVTEVDWELYKEHYDIEVIEFGGTWQFSATTGLFNEYVDKWSKVKAESEGPLRELAKLMLNSLYGKFATSRNVTGKIPTLKDGHVKYVRGPEEFRSPVYTAIGVFVTSWARDYTIRAAQENYGTFAYADTDSLHLLTTTLPTNLRIHPTELGAWKHEYSFTAALFMRAKAYIEHRDNGKLETHIAGVPEKVARLLTLDNVRNGMELSGKLAHRIVPGGVMLAEVPYRLEF